MLLKMWPRKMVWIAAGSEEAVEVRNVRILSKAAVEGAKRVNPCTESRMSVRPTTWRASPRPTRLEVVLTAAEKLEGGVRTLSITRRVMLPTVVLLTTVALKDAIYMNILLEHFNGCAYFWFRTVVVLPSVVHARTWFKPPSKNTSPDSGPRAVRPIVTLGKVVLSPAKFPNTPW